MNAPTSLKVGSTALGWQEFSDVAVIGAMTRAMPGGDGGSAGGGAIAITHSSAPSWAWRRA